MAAYSNYQGQAFAPNELLGLMEAKRAKVEECPKTKSADPRERARQAARDCRRRKKEYMTMLQCKIQDQRTRLSSLDIELQAAHKQNLELKATYLYLSSLSNSRPRLVNMDESSAHALMSALVSSPSVMGPPQQPQQHLLTVPNTVPQPVPHTSYNSKPHHQPLQPLQLPEHQHQLPYPCHQDKHLVAYQNALPPPALPLAPPTSAPPPPSPLKQESLHMSDEDFAKLVASLPPMTSNTYANSLDLSLWQHPSPHC